MMIAGTTNAIGAQLAAGAGFHCGSAMHKWRARLSVV
jgi:hypothetical protein